jgi:hypothetical protein
MPRKAATAIVSLLAVWTLTAARADDPFSFVAASDMHTSYAFPDVLASVNQTGGPGAFMVCVGDLTDASYVDAKVAEAFGPDFTWYPVVGNHDAEGQHTMEWIRAEFTNLPYIVNGGPPGSETTNYSFELGNAHLVVLNEYSDGRRFDAVGQGDVAPEVLDWLAADLAMTTKKWIFVFGHEPAFPQPDMYFGDPPLAEDSSLNLYPEHRDAFWKLLSEAGVLAFVNGHTHHHSRYFQDGVWQVDCALSKGFETHDTYIRIAVTDADVTFDVYRTLGTDTFSFYDTFAVGRADAPRLAVDRVRLLPTTKELENADDDHFVVRNTGPGSLAYTITTDADWLDVQPDAGASSGEPDSITVAYTTAALPVGQHTATITIDAPGALVETRTIAVTLTVNQRGPLIELDPIDLAPVAMQLSSPPDDGFTVRNAGDDTLAFQITDDADWLWTEPSTGASTGDVQAITVHYDTASLAPGFHPATITVTDPNALNSPQAITVRLTIDPLPMDADADGDVDITDYAKFQLCYNGPARPPGATSCAETHDYDHDGDVDLSDYSRFLDCYNGPNRAPRAGCFP